MLERAGASVLLPRERSMRREELIIDNDKGIDPMGYAESGEWSGAGSGFAHLHESYASGHNPFSDGTARQVATTNKKDKLSTATWSGSVPKSGVYSLYVSYRTVKALFAQKQKRGRAVDPAAYGNKAFFHSDTSEGFFIFYHKQINVATDFVIIFAPFVY